MRAQDSPLGDRPTNGDLWYPGPEHGQAIQAFHAQASTIPRNELQTAIHAAICQWNWQRPDDGEQKAGITWLEIQVALLLNDNILGLLHAEMGGKGWPGKFSSSADVDRIFTASGLLSELLKPEIDLQRYKMQAPKSHA